MPAPKLYVGIGNPGERYQGTRHNLGFACIDKIAAEWHATFSYHKKFNGHTAQTTGDSIYLIKPDTFVNDSGTAVQAIARFYRIETQQIVIIHDDLDLNPGTVRLKQGGGHGGHNGLKDIMEKLGSADFWRIRIGVGHPEDRTQVTPYVLSRPAQSEQQIYDQAITSTMAQLHHIATGDMARAQQELHQNGI